MLDIRSELMAIRPKEPIAAMTSVQICIRPLHASFKVSHIAIPDDVADHFDIEGITIGNKPQLPNGPLRASLFAARTYARPRLIFNEAAPLRFHVEHEAEAVFGYRIDLDTCYTAMDIIFIVRNRDGQARDFEAWLLSKADVVHDAKVNDATLDGRRYVGFIPTCSCGWRGQFTDDRDAAYFAAGRHVGKDTDVKDSRSAPIAPECSVREHPYR